MEYIQAWKWITDHWGCASWMGIREDVRTAIGLDARVGMCHGQLVTQQAARGMQVFINNINNRVAQ